MDDSKLDDTARGVEATFVESGDPDAVTVQGGVDESDAPYAELLPRGHTIGRYVIVDKLGSGSMGVVYRAFDPDLDRGIALKLVEVRATRHRRPEEIRARLLREAQAIARVSHPNVVQVFDVGTTDLGVYVAMEFVEGLTLKAWARSKPRPWREVLEVFRQAGRGLAAAHQADIVHRDFKPDNVMIGSEGTDASIGRVRVLDFGLARAATGASTESRASFDSAQLEEILAQRSFSLDESLTAHGTIVGTPAYMAPEQHLGATAGAASDQFSFCVALWEALYGERPFGGDTHAAVAFAMVHGRIRTPPSDRSVPRWVQAIVRRGLSVKPDDRYPSMAALVAELERDPNRKWRWFTMGATVLVVASTATMVTRATAEDNDTVCGGAGEKMQSVWNDERKTAIGNAFEGTGYTFAADSWTATRGLLDEYTGLWIQTRVEACRATRVHREQSEQMMDRRMACLDGQLGDLEALLHVLQTAQRQVVIGAIDAVRSLEPVTRCSQLEVTAADELTLTDPAQLAMQAELTEALTEVRARVRTGAFLGTADKLDGLESKVLDLGHPPVTSEFHELRAQVQQSTGHTPEARRSWEAAFRAALAANDDEHATYLATKLTYIVGHRLTDVEGSAFWSDLATTLLQRVDDERGRLQASLWSAEAAVSLTAGDYDRTIELEEKLQAHWEKQGDLVELANALGGLGSALRQKGDFDRAVELHARALEIAEKQYGPHHPNTAFSAHRYGTTLSFAKRHDEALEQLERSLKIHRDAQGESNMDVAMTLDGIGRALRALGRLDEAVARHEEALEILRQELGPDHLDVSVALMNIGYTHAAAEAYDEALQVFTEARDVVERSVGPDHPGGIYAANAIGTVLIELDRPAEARRVLEAALQSKAVDQVDPTLVAETKFILAQALVAVPRAKPADRTRAHTLAREARDAFAARAHHWKDQLAEIETWLVEHGK